MERVRPSDAGMLAARLMLVAVFVVTGVGKIALFDETATMMGAEVLPGARLWLALAIVAELGGAAAIALGWHARPAAVLLALYLVPVTVLFHGFWMLDGEAFRTHAFHFLKNVAIAGGLLHLAVSGAGALALDAWRLHRRSKPRDRTWREDRAHVGLHSGSPFE